MTHLSSGISASIWRCVYVWWSLIGKPAEIERPTRNNFERDYFLRQTLMAIWTLGLLELSGYLKAFSWHYLCLRINIIFSLPRINVLYAQGTCEFGAPAVSGTHNLGHIALPTAGRTISAVFNKLCHCAKFLINSAQVALLIKWHIISSATVPILGVPRGIAIATAITPRPQLQIPTNGWCAEIGKMLIGPLVLHRNHQYVASPWAKNLVKDFVSDNNWN